MEISFDALDSYGFTRWNEHFTYRCFPLPLGGNFRIDYQEKEWTITAYGEVYLRTVETLEQVNNIFHGLSDKWLFKPNPCN